MEFANRILSAVFKIGLFTHQVVPEAFAIFVCFEWDISRVLAG